jgi:hypothetical protein
MHWSRWLVLLLTFARSAWMTFDGLRALVAGDYVTPKEGPYAGRLGPWASLVQAIGIPPRATGMKLAFVLFGALGLAAVAGALLRSPTANTLLVAAALATLWYLPIGTATSLTVIALLLVFR